MKSKKKKLPLKPIKKRPPWIAPVVIAVLVILLFLLWPRQKEEIPPPTKPPQVSPQAQKTPEETPMEVKNRPPAVSKASLQLESKNNVDTIRVVAAAADPDGDPVTLTYEWKVNGNQGGKGDSFSGFKRGDRIEVSITPFDGKDHGEAKTVSTEIKNALPKITEQKEYSLEEKRLSYQIKAVDPDGDELSYSLLEAPQGMTIDSSGIIRWMAPETENGKQKILVKIDDNHGGVVTAEFEIDLSK